MIANLKTVTADESLALLRELVAKVDKLTTVVNDLAGQRRQVSGTAAATGELLRCIADAAGLTQFGSWELVEHARLPARAALREALAAAGVAENCRKIGKLLRSIEGKKVDGLRLERVGIDRDGVSWRVCEF